MEHNKSSVEVFDKLAQIYQDKFMNFDLYNDTYDFFCELLYQNGARIFEIGCGPGNITRYLLNKRPDFKIEAIDLAPAMIKLASENIEDARFRVMDCREIDKLHEVYDAILCGFCMPYLTRSECIKLIRDSAKMLNTAGLFYFSMIEDCYENSRIETSSNGIYSTFVYRHELNYLQEALDDHGFETVEIFRKYYSKSNEVQATHLIGIARKN